MSERRIYVNCMEHGKVQLTDEQYRKQLWKANDLWTCPICGNISWWAGIWHRCLDPNCNGWASEDEGKCEKCNQWQEELYYKQSASLRE